jgi:hypothetical protein
MQGHNDLIELMRNRFASSRHLLRCSLLCNLAVVAISLLTSVHTFRAANVYLPISLLLVQFGAYFLRQLSISCFSHANSVRSMALLKDGLDLEVSESQLKRLHNSLKSFRAGKLPSLVPYHDSQMPPGSRTLLHMLAESCAYTDTIARRSFEILVTVTTITALGVVGLISLITNSQATHTLLEDINLAVLVLLSIWATLDMAAIGMSYRELHYTCFQIRSKCFALRTAEVNVLDEIMHTSNLYNSALAETSHFPIKFCEATKAHLNEFWPVQSRAEIQL